MPDILLQGLVLPAEPTAFTIFPNGDVYDFFADYKYGTAVQLPQHGDLIDRDAILNAEKTKPIAKMMMFGGAYVIDLDVVRDAPVVVPAERRDADA